MENHNQSQRKSLLKRLEEQKRLMLLLSAKFGLLRALSVPLIDERIVWDVIDTLSMCSIFLLSIGAFFYVPREEKLIKCLLLALGAYAFYVVFFALIYFITGATIPEIVSLIFFSVVMSTFGLWWFIRPYDNEGIKIEKEGFYLLQKRPESIQDFFVSLCCVWGSDAGFAWYDNINKALYSYRKGRLCVSSVEFNSIQRKYIPIRFIDDVNIKDKLDFMIGTKWSLLKSNCINLRGIHG